MNEQRVKDWIERELGPGGRFRSLSQWAERANLAVSTLHGVRRTGRASRETLIKMATAAGLSEQEALQLAGWLNQDGAALSLSAEEREIVQMLRQLRARSPLLFASVHRLLLSLARDRL